MLKPETTKRNETTETSETTETKRPKRAKINEKVKKNTAFFSHQLQIHLCDIVTSQILAGPAAGPVKINERKQDEHEDIEKKLDIFHILNGILAKTRNTIF